MNSYESQRPRSDFDIHKTGTRVFQIESKFPYAFVPIQEDRSMPGYGKIVKVSFLKVLETAGRYRVKAANKALSERRIVADELMNRLLRFS